MYGGYLFFKVKPFAVVLPPSGDSVDRSAFRLMRCGLDGMAETIFDIVVRELTQQHSLFPQEKRQPVSDEEIARALEAASAFKLENTPPEEEEEFFDLFAPPTDDDGNFDYAFRRSVGITTEIWMHY